MLPGDEVKRPSPRRGILAVQAAYFLITGAWSLLHRRSFEAVTGRKHDYWLVQTIGAVVTAVGVVLAGNLTAPRTPRGTYLLAGLTALALGAVDTVHAARRRISRIYLADAAAEAVFIVNALAGLGVPPEDEAQDIPQWQATAE